ncbi:uncharacterized protein [Nicotiana tomentosiformis]|uniref:uncharacterized protein n=1 Tax=Nicotiana tomentosiformis TaxID=4098 RepID=UPI00388C74FD
MGSSSKLRGYDLCHKCGKPGHFIKNFLLLKQDQYKHNTNKATKRNPVPDKKFKRKDAAENVMKQAFAAWGDSFSKYGEDDEQADTSMMAVESEAAKYDSIFALMEKSDDVEDEINFLDVQRNLKSYSQKKLISLANILIDVYHNLINDKNVLIVELGEGEVKGTNQRWYMDSGFSKHMTGSIDDFISLKVLQGGSVSFGNGKKGYILGVGRVRKMLTHSIENVYYFVKKDLVRGLPKSRFKDHKVCDACVRGKQVRSSFNPKNKVSTTRPLDLLHMDICGPMRVLSRGGKKYIFVIVDDYSRFIWTLFLKTKDETFPVFVAFVKQIQVKMRHNVVSIRSDHGTEFENTKFDEFCAKNVLNNGKEALGKFDAKSDEGIFLGYSSQRKSYQVYNKRTQCVEESIHVIFDDSHHLCGKGSHDKIDQDGEQPKVKESNEENTIVASADTEEPGSSITTTEAEDRVADAVQGTPGEIQTRSKTFSTFLSQIEPKNIKEALKDADWITTMQNELHQFERNRVWHQVP